MTVTPLISFAFSFIDALSPLQEDYAVLLRLRNLVQSSTNALAT